MSRSLAVVPTAGLRAVAAAAAALTMPCAPAAADDPAPAAPAIEWREFGREAFREAERRGVPVFLWLTAPWNRDHFLLSGGLFADPEAVRALNERSVPVRADATLAPELRPLYRIGSGLLPSLHFLGADARPHLSVPPVETSELLLFLSESIHDTNPAPGPGPRPTWEVNPRKLANRIARQVVAAFRRGGYDLAPTHADVDPSPVTFVLEYMLAFPQRREWFRPLMQEVRDLVASPLHDRVDGGFHRAIADPALGIPHHEKLLRPNAEIAAILASWARLTRDSGAGDVSAATVRALNRFFRVGDRTLWAGSLAADLYGPAGDRVLLHGAEYYALDVEARRRYPGPRHSREVPVGANFVVVQSLRRLLGTFDDDKLRDAVGAAGRTLREEGFLADGAARRALGDDATGNLRDQGDAGCGLLAYHAVTGDPEALEAARRVAAVLERDFWDGDRGVFRNVSRRDDVPDFVADAEPDPAWNGIAMRFVTELDAATGEDRWRERVEGSLRGWADRIPVDGIGIAELGRAALRTDRALPVLVVAADPGSAEGEELREIALRLFDPLAIIRWIRPGSGREAARFGVRPEGAPAMYLVWDGVSPPIRDAAELESRWDAARRRIRR